jgi:hypothetical protein
MPAHEEAKAAARRSERSIPAVATAATKAGTTAWRSSGNGTVAKRQGARRPEEDYPY